MPQSISRVLVHIVFSTKQREPLIGDDIRPDLHAYLGGIIRNRKASLIVAGGIEDHMHLLVRLPMTIAIADLVRDVKANSSTWMRERIGSHFAWQAGYGAFSVGPPQEATVVSYIRNQREHHRATSFQDEYRSFMQRYGIEFDECFVWD
jgi:REP element-mobilizing transposase RayT